MKQLRPISVFSTAYALIAFLAAAAQALSLSGRCYQGVKPDQSNELQGVTVKLYGASEAQGSRNHLDTMVTGSNGWYGLTVTEGYEHYFIVADGKTGYTFNSASSVDGSVSGSEIHYSLVSAPLADQTLTGNKFWYTNDTPANNPPVADADGPYVGPAGQSLTLDGSGSYDLDPGDSIVSYAWDLDGDGQYDDASGVNPGHTWNTTGFFTISLRVTDSHGASDTDTSTVTIEEDGPGGSIVVIKKATPADDTPFMISAHYTPGGFFDTLGTQLKDPSQNTTTIASPELVTRIVENVDSGWILTDITISGDTDDGSTIDLPSATVNVDYDPGEHIVIVFKNARKDPDPSVEQHVFGICLDLDLDVANLGPSHVSASGPASEILTYTATGGKTGDHDSDGLDDVPVDLVALNLTGTDPILGRVTIGLNPNRPSKGHIEERVNNTPGMIDVAPHAPAGIGDITLDVYFEIRLPDLGMTLHADQSKRLTAVLDFVAPPWPNNYNESPFATVNLLDPSGDNLGSLGTVTSCEANGDPGASVGDWVWEDLNRNGIQDTGEKGLAGVHVDLLDAAGHPVAGSTTTNALGFYQFNGLSPAQYAIRFSLPTGYRFSPAHTGADSTIDSDAHQGTGETNLFTLSVGEHNTDMDAGLYRSDDPGPQQDSDYGDAPDSYKTLHASGGAHHRVGPLTLGNSVDVETDGLPTVDAYGDDHTQGDDEDAVVYPGDLSLTRGRSGRIRLRVNNGDGAAAHVGTVVGWIDFNGDGRFQNSTEGLGATQLTIPGGGQAPVELNFSVPGNAKIGLTYARLRLYRDQSNAAAPVVSPAGWGGGGEVEDYRVEITGTPTQQHIHGYKWHDLNGNGLWDIAQPVEPALAGWTFWLDTNHNGTRDGGDMTTQSDTSGHFLFTAVPDGTYTLGEVQQSGWQQILPGAPGTYQVTVAGGQGSFPMMFGNRQDDGGGPGPEPNTDLDWGDAPDPTYPTLRANNGAAHIIVPGFFLGGGVDGEPDGQAASDAQGDDHGSEDDEDGVLFLTPLIPGQSAQVEVVLPAAGRLDAWIDFDGDGNWGQTLDQVFQNEALLPGSNVLALTVPAAAAGDITTFARFRLSTTGGLLPLGAAADGEVEDYRLLLGEEGPHHHDDREVPHLKWSQPPLEIDPDLDPDSGPPVYCGWHEPALSTQPTGSKRRWRMVVDDFHCLGHIPVTRLRWWGTYKAWGDMAPPEHAQPEAWHIGFWAHLEDGWTADQLFPERLMWSVEVPVERVSTHATGLVTYPAKPTESGFAHELALEPHEWFHPAHFPARGDVFWISITAVYPVETEPKNIWGWLTRPQPWGRGAKMPAIFGDWPNSQERLFPGRTSPIMPRSPCNNNAVYDMAFELFTEQPWVIWNQPLLSLQEWPWVTDAVSQIHEPRDMDPTVLHEVADDWLCEGDTPVRAVSWQGSYLGYGYEACLCQDPPAPPRPNAFRLSILANNGGQPGSVLWEVETQNYDEVLVGVDRHPEGEPNEAVFRYSARLARKNWFQPAAPGQHLWFKVTAVYEGEAGDVPHTWGWTTRAHGFASPALQNQVTPAGPLWEPLADPEAGPVDMAFTLYTSPPTPAHEGASAVAEYLRDTLLEGSFNGQSLWMSPGPLDVTQHTIQDLRPGQGEVAWPAAEGDWWIVMLDSAPQGDWPRDVRWVFVREDLAMYRPWSSSYPPEIYNHHGEHVPLHCVPLALEGLGMCRD